MPRVGTFETFESFKLCLKQRPLRAGRPVVALLTTARTGSGMLRCWRVDPATTAGVINHTAPHSSTGVRGNTSSQTPPVWLMTPAVPGTRYSGYHYLDFREVVSINPREEGKHQQLLVPPPTAVILMMTTPTALCTQQVLTSNKTVVANSNNNDAV